jgi:hypothetical protein
MDKVSSQEFQRRLGRVEQLITGLENSPDPAAPDIISLEVDGAADPSAPLDRNRVAAFSECPTSNGTQP